MPPKKRTNIGQHNPAAKRQKAIRASETAEQRELRLQRDRIRTSISRANAKARETAEERELRLQQQRIRASTSRARRRAKSQKLQWQWKNVKYTYSQTLKNKRKIKSEPGLSKQPVSKFLDELSFMQMVTSSKETTNTLTEKPEQDSSFILPNSPPRQTSPFLENDRKEQETVVVKLERNDDYSEEQNKELENDCDKAFLESLLSRLKEIPEHARFGVKRKLMDVIDAEKLIYHPKFVLRKTFL